MLLRLKYFPLVIVASLSVPAYASNLYHIYNDARTYDPNTLASLYKAQKAGEAIREAKSNFLPQIASSVSLGTRGTSQSEPKKEWGATVGISQTIYDHSNFAALTLTEKEFALAELNLTAAHQRLVMRVISAYIELLCADERLRLARNAEADYAVMLTKAQNRLNAGLDAETDSREALAQRDAAHLMVLKSENDLEASFERLYEISGKDYTTIERINFKDYRLEKAYPVNSDTWEKQALSSSLKLIASTMSADVARQKLRLAKTGKLPTISLSASAQRVTGQSSELTTNRVIDVTASIPLYTGGKLTSQVKQAAYDYSIAQEVRRDTLRGVTRSIRTLDRHGQHLVQSLQANNEAMTSAKSALDAIQAGYESGTRTMSDVLQGINHYYSTLQSFRLVRYDIILSNIKLRLESGTLTEQSIIEINSHLKGDNLINRSY